MLGQVCKIMEEVLASKRKDVAWTLRNTSGEYNPNYNGGKYIDDKGYVRILDQDHPFGIKGYVYEHRSVFETYLNRHLQPWETVHHINEIKTDNRVQNLFLCTVPEHSAIHREGKKPTDSHRKKMRENMHKRNKETRENRQKSFKK